MNVVQGISGEKATRELDRDWWQGAVIYQIYPRSFQDSNGDGIGDLNGITQRLTHVASLGVDAIWISPFFKSPMLDFGYDVSDYRAVDPMFGTMDDFDALIAEAHRLDIKVIIDQVISHSSSSHPWFEESRTSKTNDKSDWYVWANAKPDGTPPNNWLSIFGGSAWQWDTSRCQYFLHNFLSTQPDLNFHNIDVQDAMLDAARFWLDKGVDGFRLDTINFYFHSGGLEDNPPLPHSERNNSIAPAVNPYNYQNHLFDKNQPENIEFLKRFRSLLDEYPAAIALGEVGDAQNGLDIVSNYTSGNDKVHLCYSFDFLSPEPLTPARVKKTVSEFNDKIPGGGFCWAFSNHDVMRHASRLNDQTTDRDKFLKMTATLILTLRGAISLYQGEELGLTEAEIEFDDLQDPYGIQFWPEFKGRDGCRTPMLWSHNEVNGGFSQGDPWLPIPDEHLNLAVDAQKAEDDSILNHYRALLAFRAKHRELSKGTMHFHEGSSEVILYERRLGDQAMLVAINMSGHDTQIDLPIGVREMETPAPGVLGQIEGNILKIPAFGSYFARLSSDTRPRSADGGNNDKIIS